MLHKATDRQLQWWQNKNQFWEKKKKKKKGWSSPKAVHKMLWVRSLFNLDRRHSNKKKKKKQLHAANKCGPSDPSVIGTCTQSGCAVAGSFRTDELTSHEWNSTELWGRCIVETPLTRYSVRTEPCGTHLRSPTPDLLDCLNWFRLAPDSYFQGCKTNAINTMLKFGCRCEPRFWRSGTFCLK